MSSSTFSSRFDLKTIATVVLVLGLAEACLRLAESRLSQDRRHLQAIPSIVRDLSNAESPRVLFLGNSLTKAGIQPDVLSSSWRAGGKLGAAIARIHPDDTGLADWLYLYRRFIEPPEAEVDLLVIGFAWSLADDQTLHVERLGGDFGNLALAGYAFANDIPSLGDRIGYLLGATSRLWANRERIRTRALALLPGYEDLAPILNGTVRASTRSDATRPKSYDRLTRFLELTRRRGTRVLMVALPVATRYPVTDELVEIVRRQGGHLLDMQEVGLAGPADFPDGLHMSPQAAGRFSQALSQAMAQEPYVRSALGLSEPLIRHTVQRAGD